MIPERDENPQAPHALRNHEARGRNYLVDLAVVHDQFEAADVAVAEVDADWGTPFRVLGFEHVLVAVDYTDVAGTTGFVLAVQVSDQEGTSVDTLWYDLYVDEAGDGTLVRKVYECALSGNGRVAFQVPVPGGTYMRLKAWASGAGPATGGRLVVRARTHMQSV